MTKSTTHKTHTVKPKLTSQQINDFQQELDALRQSIEAKMGQEDIDHIQSVIEMQRYLEVSGRLLIHFSLEPVSWALGVASLSAAHILENMEIGHNVIHGQFDFMGDPHLNGKRYEWDILGTSNNWRQTHNFKHHTYTNIQGFDDDIGYDIIRVFPEQKWSPWFLLQPIYSLLFAFVFEWGVALQNVNFKVKKGRSLRKQLKEQNPEAWQKMKHQLLKDYVVFPLLAGPMILPVFLGNVVANVIRSLWTFVIIFCGHFTEKTVVFAPEEAQKTSNGDWYLRQIRSSSNIKGGFLFHVLSGNLSHQIEHHLFPEIPANRYRELAPAVKDICVKYGQTYNTGRLSSQFFQVVTRIVKYSLPIGRTA